MLSNFPFIKRFFNPDNLSDDEQWSKERTIREYENERTRRKMMRQDIYA